MRGLRLAALAALLAGIALLVYAGMQGSLRVGFFLIIPFFYGTGAAAALGMLLLMAAGVLWFMGAFQALAPPPSDGGEAPPPAGGAHAPPERVERRSSSGGVVLLGPIPIVWGSDRRVLPWMVATGAALLVLALLVSFALR